MEVTLTKQIATTARLAAGSILLLAATTAATWPALAEDADDAAAQVATASEIEHPEKAICRTCAMRGSQHGDEDVVDLRERAGRFYYFCSKPCAEAFDAFPAAYEDKVYPRPAPAATLSTLDGSPLALTEVVQSKDVVLLDFWATWCKPCEKTMPEIQELHDEFASQGLRVLGVSIDEKGAKHVREWLDGRDFDYPMAVDTSDSPAWFHYGVPAVPAMFLIDREGQIVAEWKGMVDMDEVRPKIAELLKVSAD